jgi:putative Mg2+ transporter-C (MgtC) family protein
VEEFLLRLGISSAWVDALHLGLLGRLLLAAFLGGLIGLEREVEGKPAGLRTNLLICVGATLLMEISLSVATAANVVNAAEGVPFRADPARIAAQIVSGIGFLGAGTILQARGSVIGLTTAATIWVVAAIGMAIGARAYVEAVGSTVLVGATLVFLGRIEREMIRRRRTRRYIFTLDPDPELLEMVEQAFREEGLRVETASVEKDAERYEASFDVSGAARLHGHVVRALIARPGIHKMTRAL